MGSCVGGAVPGSRLLGITVEGLVVEGAMVEGVARATDGGELGAAETVGKKVVEPAGALVVIAAGHTLGSGA